MVPQDTEVIQFVVLVPSEVLPNPDSGTLRADSEVGITVANTNAVAPSSPVRAGQVDPTCSQPETICGNPIPKLGNAIQSLGSLLHALTAFAWIAFIGVAESLQRPGRANAANGRIALPFGHYRGP